ncbi:L-seryl-tRNA(Sec) selenium transferase [Halanaerobium saccharolyticum]|uniref:L-seryl-tRNA(Sec) selenium transferase n=1 Tax=Halanaerobium saccharolyticum TaxID=43595 RepID=A0A4R7Z911_9FIRM|nr:L-seryl-tRNA(Sec) selenium transferase [Halanaerobium saccharolyticum]RAK11769.1 L-seryl-tRNA(Sec) selenium transferase [Halanaerobium saccharolyticum]TDW07610.1 L-seryl-tRNA(Sec) selenium transferase [Halanaerobium saccharolyticum]TDX64531.1 L-seryl-tRNA(Sec) selenium transferase [Halanaerobium saccharolyticum]
MGKEELLKLIPAVNDILSENKSEKIKNDYSRADLLEGIRYVTDNLRTKILADDFSETNFDQESLKAEKILDSVKIYLKNIYRPEMSPAINATGVVIHTNLGRSLLADSAAEAVNNVALHYSTLEINRDTGERGDRYSSVQDIIKKLTGAEASLVVNNNAAAVTLVLAAIAEDKEVVISRGELVEIGGSFRVPEVMEQSGARLVEVGSTNKVYLKDYLNAVTEETGAFLKVHTSNYRIQGFTATVEAEDLVNDAHQRDIPVIEDLGSGIIFDLQSYGLPYEPTVKESIDAGIDLVTFSGDKLLGGPQAGIIVGKKKYIKKLEHHPLLRALRVDKFTLAALEATLKLYRNFDDAVDKIPTLKMLTESAEKVMQRAEKLFSYLDEYDNFTLKIEKDTARIGGGSYPLTEIKTYVLTIDSELISSEELAYKLRQAEMPIFSRIKNQKLIIDLKTVQPAEIKLLAAEINQVLREEV